MTHQQSPLSFRVQCTACYGTEVWTLGRITRTLTAADKLPPSSASDIEFIAQQFIDYHKRILCPGCNKVGVMKVQRIKLEE